LPRVLEPRRRDRGGLADRSAPHQAGHRIAPPVTDGIGRQPIDEAAIETGFAADLGGRGPGAPPLRDGFARHFRTEQNEAAVGRDRREERCREDQHGDHRRDPHAGCPAAEEPRHQPRRRGHGAEVEAEEDRNDHLSIERCGDRMI
jgi:hypothetical protein